MDKDLKKLKAIARRYDEKATKDAKIDLLREMVEIMSEITDRLAPDGITLLDKKGKKHTIKIPKSRKGKS